jgi:predicted transcriptional regulator
MQNQEKPMQPLDLQSLDRNYFWIERPKAIINELSDFFYKVEDASYINDDVPSVMINHKYQVFLPNSVRESEYETNRYAIIRDSELQQGNTENMQFTDDLDRVIEIVGEMIDDDNDTIKRSEVLHRIKMIMDDLVVIRMQMTDEQLKLSTGFADDLYTHFNNIAIACDLDSNESLSWKLYSKGAKND